MDPLKDLRSQLEQKIGRAWEMLTEGWRELLTRSGGALTHFDRRAKTGEEPRSAREFPRWSLLAAETWETAQAVIIRVEVPGTRKEDLDVKLDGNLLVVQGFNLHSGQPEGLGIIRLIPAGEDGPAVVVRIAKIRLDTLLPGVCPLLLFTG